MFLVLLVIIFPVALAESLERVKKSSDIVETFETVVSQGSYSYEPYLQMDPNIWGHVSSPYPELNPCRILEVNGSGGTMYPYLGISGSMTFDYDGTKDLVIGTSGHGTRGFRFYYGMWGDASELLNDGIDLLSVYLGIDQWFRLDSLGIGYIQTNYKTAVLEPIDISGSDGWFYGDHQYIIEITDADLNNGASIQEGRDPDFYTIQMIFIFDHFSGAENPIVTDVQLNPEYFELATYNNQTSIGYLPIVSTVTSYKVHHVMMLLGGVGILLVGVVASPLPIGDNFNPFFPITNFQKKYLRSDNEIGNSE